MYVNFAYTSDVQTWASSATLDELKQALDKDVSDIKAAWSDDAATFPAMRERVILAELSGRLAR